VFSKRHCRITFFKNNRVYYTTLLSKEAANIYSRCSQCQSKFTFAKIAGIFELPSNAIRMRAQKENPVEFRQDFLFVSFLIHHRESKYGEYADIAFLNRWRLGKQHILEGAICIDAWYNFIDHLILHPNAKKWVFP